MFREARYVQGEGATLSAEGNLLGQGQSATVQLDGLPLDVFRPLVQAALPNLQASREAPSTFAPVTKPLAALQRQLRRSVESLMAPQGPLATKRGTATAADLNPAPIRGLLHVQGSLTGPVDTPEGEVNVRVDNAALGTLRLSEASARGRIRGDGVARLQAAMVPSGTSGRVEMDCEVHVPDGQNLTAHLHVKDAGMLVLSELAGENARWQEGRAAVHVSAVGSVGDPLVTADAQFARGRMMVPHLREPLRGLSGRLRLANNAVSVTNVQASCGKSGVIKVGGSLPLNAQPPAGAVAEVRCRVFASAQ